MAKVKTAVMKAAMSGLYHTGAHRLLAPYTQGQGVIFTLHHVRPEPEEPKAFAPNRILEVTPEFLDAVLDQVQEAGLDVVSLDEAVRKLTPALKFELPVVVAVLPAGASARSDKTDLADFSALGCPVLVYEQNGKEPRSKLMGRVAAI